MMNNTVKGQEFMENARLEHEYLEQVVKKNLKYMKEVHSHEQEDNHHRGYHRCMAQEGK